MTRLFVTTFSVAGYKLYGRRFLEHFVRFFPKHERLVVFYELEKPDIVDPRITYLDLTEDQELVSFLERHKDKPAAHGIIAPSTVPNYRFQANKWVRKVMAFTSPLIPTVDWEIWIDADVVCKEEIPKRFFEQYIRDKAVIAYYIGRPTAWDHSECGFVAYNTSSPHTREFLRKFRALYTSDKVFELPQWHDSYVFDHLRTVYEAADHVFINIAEGHDTIHPWSETFLGKYTEHLKGPEAKLQAAPEPTINLSTFMAGCKTRYEQLPRMISAIQPTEIVEVGTFDGKRAVEMCTEALKHVPNVHYVGFDIWEDGTPMLNTLEGNAKGTVPLWTAQTTLDELAAVNPAFTYELIKGNTRQTLPAFHFMPVKRFAFIDGGHSVETIRSDYATLKPHCQDIIFDDFYVEGKDTAKVGCNSIVATEKNILLPKIDEFFDSAHGPGFKVAMVLVGESTKDIQKALQPINLKTRNCAANEVIQANVKYCAQLTPQNRTTRLEAIKLELDWLQGVDPVYFVDQVFTPVEEPLILVSAGDALRHTDHPEYSVTWESLRAHAVAGRKIVCNKTNHDLLIERSLIPYGCVLLDPRDHVAEKFKPHKDVIYFVSSMCHGSTWNHLLAQKAKIIGYHAAVGAGESTIVEQEFKSGLMISGGTSSVLRSFWLFYTLGFRNFESYALDSSYWKRPEKSHGRTEKPIIEVEVHGRKFITDAEMIAQSQDVEALLKVLPDCTYIFHGDGMLQHAAGIVRQGIDKEPGRQEIVDLRLATWLHAFKKNDLKTEYIYMANAISALNDRWVQIQDVKDQIKLFDAKDHLV